MTGSVTVVMPVHDEAAHLPATLDALVEAVRRSDFSADVVLVDDGSADGSAEVAAAALGERLPLRVLSQPSRGRFLARKAGVEAATGEWTLLLDGRVRIAPEALAFAERRLGEGASVWTSDVTVQADGSPYGTFWKLIADLAWPDYFNDPRETSFGADDFDRYPKGTTCFLAPRALLLEAMDSFRTRYADPRHANDDTVLLRWIAARTPIHVAPGFGASYNPRSTLRAFVRHSAHRGVVFLDGHGRRESRFYPAAVAFYPLSALLVLAAWRRPRVIPLAALATSLAAAGLGISRRRSSSEIRALALLAPVYAAAHGVGMWRGLLMSARARLRAGARRQPPPRARERSRSEARAGGGR